MMNNLHPFTFYVRFTRNRKDPYASPSYGWRVETAEKITFDGYDASPTFQSLTKAARKGLTGKMRRLFAGVDLDGLQDTLFQSWESRHCPLAWKIEGEIPFIDSRAYGMAEIFKVDITRIETKEELVAELPMERDIKEKEL